MNDRRTDDAGAGRGLIYAVFEASDAFTVGSHGVVTPGDMAALADALLTQAVETLDPACQCLTCASVRAARAALAPVRSQRAPSTERPH